MIVDSEQPVTKKPKKMTIKPVLQLTSISEGNVILHISESTYYLYFGKCKMHIVEALYTFT